jgi:hypothetical protein
VCSSLVPIRSHNLTAGIFPIVAGGIVSHRTPLELHLGAVYCDHPVAPAPLDRDAHSEEAGIAADIYAVVPTIVHHHPLLEPGLAATDQLAAIAVC